MPATTGKKKIARAETRANAPTSSSRQSAKEVQHAEKYPKPPFKPQHQRSPGLESQMEPQPQFMAPLYKGSGKLQDKTAIVAGCDSGIGRATAVLFAREGADVAIVFLPDVSFGRPGQPEELAPAYVFLASNIMSSYISGVILPVLGGDTIAG